MANRRMFSKDVMEMEEFLDMPASAQNLYFHLSMEADDDGFVSPDRVIRIIRANPDDLKVLIAKNFIIPFEKSRVVVITHWNENNHIPKDRYHPTINQTEMKQLQRTQNVYKLDTQFRLDKIRKDEAKEIRELDNKETIKTFKNEELNSNAEWGSITNLTRHVLINTYGKDYEPEIIALAATEARKSGIPDWNLGEKEIMIPYLLKVTNKKYEK